MHFRNLVRCSGAVARACIGFLLGATVGAQCTNPWLAGDGLAGANGQVTAMTMWDRDGPGPLPPLLVLGGTFTIVGTAVATALATYDPATGAWAALGGLTGTFNGEIHVRALATTPGGELVVGGNFLYAGGQPVANIARWNGSTWSSFGNGIGGYVTALACRPNGDIIAAGDFQVADGVAVNRIARWDGNNWSAMGGGTSQVIHSLTSLPNGDVVAGGLFASISGVSANHIARWDGASWSPLGSGLFGDVFVVLATAAGDVLAGGTFVNAGGVAASGIARWDGVTWSPLGSGLSNPAYSMAFASNGDLIVGGVFQLAGGNSALRIARWNGSAWSALGSGLGGLGLSVAENVLAVASLPNGDVVAGGVLTLAGGSPVLQIARWDGASWNAFLPVTTGTVSAIATISNGDIVVGGSFTQLGGVLASRIARRIGGSWSPLGAGSSGEVRALAELMNGDLVAGGTFTTAGGAPAANVARWNGAGWAPFGTGLSGDVNALAVLGNGDLVAAGAFPQRVARWDGQAWQPMLPPGSAGSYAARSLAVLPSGDLVAAGFFLFPAVPAGVARWDGSTWSPYPGTQYLTLLAVTPNGDLVAGGNYVARWTGSSWTYLNPGWLSASLRVLRVLPTGDIVAGTDNYLSGLTTRIQHWNGSAWSPMAEVDGGVYTLGLAANDDLLVGGSFRRVDSTVSAVFARRTTTCPALVSPFGSGCVGSGGLAALAADGWPWIGTTFRSRAGGMPLNGLAVGVLGFAPAAVPLASILGPALPGCSLWVTPALLSVHVPIGGAVAVDVPLPNSGALVGGVLHQQIVPLELDVGGALVAVTATNALSLTIGSY